MTSPYYNPSGAPTNRAQLSSSAIRAELNAIKNGFEKLAPILTANALLHVNAAGTQQVAHTSITVSAAGAVAGITNLAYTGTLTGGTGIVNIGSNQIYKDASGNVGLGISAPTQKLDINGGMRIFNAATLGANEGSGLFDYTHPDFRAYVGDGTGYTWRFCSRSGGVTKDFLIIKDDGNVIQTTQASPPTLTIANQVVFNMTSNTSLRISGRGSDGITRFVNLVLAP